MMSKIYVYALKSVVRNYIYVGQTNDIERRFHDHNNGYNATTKPYIPFTKILVEEYSNRTEARKREKYLKSGEGKAALKKLAVS